MAEKPLKIGIIMDPIQSITPYKDSSLAMLLEAERRNAEIHYFEQKDLSLVSGTALGQSTLLHVRDDNDDWFELGDQHHVELGDLDAILMRKDPPFDMEYIYTTYILDRAQEAGALVVNAPQALRDMNEKAYTAGVLLPPDARTDGAGRVVLEMPEGSHRIRYFRVRGFRIEEVRFTSPTEGVVEVRLEQFE